MVLFPHRQQSTLHQKIKKLDQHYIKKYSHVGPENSQTLAPPIHRGAVAHLRNDRDWNQTLDMYFGMGQTRG